MRFRLWLAVIPLIIVLLAPCAFGQKVLLPLPADLQGELNGVPYHIMVPANWNGTLLVYAYGYAEAYDPPPLTPMAPATTDRDILLAKGFALAGLRASGAVELPGASTVAGWNVKERIQETAALTAAFRGIVGQPKRTIVWGKSMGGLISLALIEKFPGLFDGAVPLCAPGAGTPAMFDLKLGITLAYAAAFDWKEEWGTPGNLRPDLNFMAEVFYPNVVPRLSDAYKLNWEFLRMLNKIPDDISFYALNYRVQALWLAFVPQPDMNLRAGGQVAQNLTTAYTLTDNDRQLLKQKFPSTDPKALMDQVDGWLSKMNNSARYISDPNARNYAKHYYDPTGLITRPVITLHTTGDAAAIPNNEAAYRTTVEAHGKQQLLMQVFTTGVDTTDSLGKPIHVNTHCTFYPAQYFAGINAMVQWLNTGTRPNPSDFFTEAMGFDTDYVPDPWPW